MGFFRRLRILEQDVASLQSAVAAIGESLRASSKTEQPVASDATMHAVAKVLETIPVLTEQFGRLAASFPAEQKAARISGARATAGRRGGKQNQEQKSREELQSKFQTMIQGCTECSAQARGVPWADRQFAPEITQKHAAEHEAPLDALINALRVSGGAQLALDS